jgi:FkbM family methyltransferase
MITKTTGYQPIVCRKERFVFNTLAEWVKPDTVAYDIGANEGIYTCFIARKAPAGHVFAFEPVGENLSMLLCNSLLNAVPERVTAVQTAVSNVAGVARFHHGKSLCEGHLEESDFGECDPEAFTVPTTSLDGWMDSGNPPPDIMKIDVEGAGALVLSGSRRILSTVRPLVVFECHTIHEAQGALRIATEHDYIVRDAAGQPWDGSRWATFLTLQPSAQLLRRGSGPGMTQSAG